MEPSSEVRRAGLMGIVLVAEKVVMMVHDMAPKKDATMELPTAAEKVVMMVASKAVQILVQRRS